VDAALLASNLATELALTPNARLRMKAPEKDSKKALYYLPQRIGNLFAE
jgi:hypothetical protein